MHWLNILNKGERWIIDFIFIHVFVKLLQRSGNMVFLSCLVSVSFSSICFLCVGGFQDSVPVVHTYFKSFKRHSNVHGSQFSPLCLMNLINIVSNSFSWDSSCVLSENFHKHPRVKMNNPALSTFFLKILSWYS